MKRLYSQISAFIRDTSGAVMIEFVMVLPILLGILLLIVFVSLLLMTLADVQNLAYEMARMTLRYTNVTNPAALCNALRDGELAARVQGAIGTLNPARITLSCDIQNFTGVNNTRVVSVSVIYNFVGDGLQAFGRSIGWSIGTFTRTASILH